MRMLKTFFSFTYWLGNKIVLLSQTKIISILYFVQMFILLLLAYYNCPFWSIVICTIILFVLSAINISEKSLLSISGFLGKGLYHWFIIFMLFICLLETRIEIVDMIVWNIISAITWWFYSLLANNKVANVGNIILSTLFAIVVLFKDAIISIISDYEGKAVELVFNITFSPVLATNLIALMLCALKGYWIEKYNNNNDLSWPVVEGIVEEAAEEETE